MKTSKLYDEATVLMVVSTGTATESSATRMTLTKKVDATMLTSIIPTVHYE